MSKFGRNKIALLLACASIFGVKTQAAQNIKTEQSLGAVASGALGNSRALKKSKSMSNLTVGLTIGGSVGVAGLIGYEVLGDTVFDNAPTLLKLIRGKKSNKHEQVAQENMQMINNEMNDLEDFKKGESKQYQKGFEFFKKEFESIKQLIIDYGTSDVWSKIICVTYNDSKYVTNENDVPPSFSNTKPFKDENQKKDLNSRLMKKFAGIFNGEIKIKGCKKIINGINIIIDNECYYIQRFGDELVLTTFIKGKEKEHYFEIVYNLK